MSTPREPRSLFPLAARPRALDLFCREGGAGMGDRTTLRGLLRASEGESA